MVPAAPKLKAHRRLIMESGSEIRRGGRRVALVACYPLRDPAMPPQFLSNHGMRMVEASLHASGLDGLEVRAYDLVHASEAVLLKDLLDFDPDVVGFSAYLWSFEFFTRMADLLKRSDPRRLVVFGGPSARPSMLNLEPHRWARRCIDALVISEGEQTFLEMIALRDRSAASLGNVAGLALPVSDGWAATPGRPLADLNVLPSPYDLDLVPGGGLGLLQTYRGCPFTCTFCEWGTLESPKRVREVESLARELSAMDRTGVDGALLVDAGLNLNRRAFRNLRQAADSTGFFSKRMLICELYPAKVTKEHIDFLSSIGRPLVGVGLQSFDNRVLAHVDRNYDELRFEEVLHQLTEVAGVSIEIILGLPGDTPENFRATFRRARSLPCSLRVYHCVVLPSALMVRAPASYRLDFDYSTLKMRSCLGWTEAQLAAEQEYVTRQAMQHGGEVGEYFWTFPRP